MKRSNKKGFTTVELVIVIAVIAILAAVLIPTFANLIKKANVSADTQLAKNLNTALAMDEATNGSATEFVDVLNAARDAGYIISNLNPTTEGCYFVWESTTNQIMLVDGEDGYKVIYAVEEGYPAIGATWYFAIADKDAAAALEADLEAKGYTANIKDMVANIEDFSNALAQGGTQELYIDESVVLSNGENLTVSTAGSNITIELGNGSIATDGLLSNPPVSVKADCTLTVNGGNLSGAGQFENENGTFSYAMTVDKNGKLYVNNMTIVTDKAGIAGCYATDGDAYVEVNDSKITAGSCVLSLSCGGQGGKAVLNNVTAHTSSTSAENPAFFVSQGSEIVINSGTYTTAKYMFRVDNNTGGQSQIVINGGTFNGKTLAELGVEGLQTLTSKGTVKANGDGTFTITLN